MAADIFTKAFASAEKWWDVRRLIRYVFPSGTFPVRSGSDDGLRDASMGRPSAKGVGKLLATSTPMAAPSSRHRLLEGLFKSAVQTISSSVSPPTAAGVVK